MPLSCSFTSFSAFLSGVISSLTTVVDINNIHWTEYSAIQYQYPWQVMIAARQRPLILLSLSLKDNQAMSCHNLPFVRGLLVSQTTRLPMDVAVRARVELDRKIDWLNFPTGLLKSSSVRGGAKYSRRPPFCNRLDWNSYTCSSTLRPSTCTCICVFLPLVF